MVRVSYCVVACTACAPNEDEDVTGADTQAGSESGMSSDGPDSTMSLDAGSDDPDAGDDDDVDAGEDASGGSAEGGGAEGGDDGGSGSPCINDQLELTDVVLEFTTNRVLGEDIVAAFDPAQGSSACAWVSDERVQVRARFGPFDLGEPRSSFALTLYDGARVYDLETDPGPPGSGDPGLIEFGFTYMTDSTTTYSFGTINQACVGTVDALALPIDGGTTVEFTGVGELAGPGGWEFDMHFSAVVMSD
jgi:hypothetical protein